MAKKQTPKQAFSAEWAGNGCGGPSKGTYVAKTQAEWEKLWDSANGNLFPAPRAPKLPKNKMAVGIFLGSQSGPAEVKVTKVEDNNNKTNITWHSVGRASMLCVMHEPYLLKLIEKTDNPVVFTKENPPRTTPAIDLKKLKKINPPGA